VPGWQAGGLTFRAEPGTAGQCYEVRRRVKSPKNQAAILQRTNVRIAASLVALSLSWTTENFCNANVHSPHKTKYADARTRLINERSAHLAALRPRTRPSTGVISSLHRVRPWCVLFPLLPVSPASISAWKYRWSLSCFVTGGAVATGFPLARDANLRVVGTCARQIVPRCQLICCFSTFERPKPRRGQRAAFHRCRAVDAVLLLLCSVRGEGTFVDLDRT